MEIYTTEEQQAEAIKKWVKDNGLSVLVGAVLGLSAIFGWKWWVRQQAVEQATASAEYTAQISRIATMSAQQLENNVLQFEKLHQSKVYQNLLQLKVAKKAVTAGQLAIAETALRVVVEKPAHRIFELLARLRLARVLIEQKKFDAAIAMVKLSDKNYQALFDEIRGDAQWAKGDVQAAHKSFVAAERASAVGSFVSPALRLKVNNTQRAIGIVSTPEATERKPGKDSKHDDGARG